MRVRICGLLRCGVVASLVSTAAAEAQTTPEQQATQATPTSLPNGDASPNTDAVPADIVVTAQFRNQALQKTPISITALSGATLENRAALNITDVGAYAPDVTVKPGGSAYGPAAQVFIRGVGQADSSFSQEPGVGVYIDDVYQGTLLGSLFDLVDLDRIEVLRGPQGTLAGKNSIGGAIKIFTKKPDETGGGVLSFGYGSFNRFDAKGSVNATLVPDKLFFRGSFLVREQDGYVTRLDYGCLNPGRGVPTYATSRDCKLGTEGGLNDVSLRGALRWTPTDRLEVNVSSDYTRDHNEVSATKLVKTTSTILNSLPGVSFVTGPTDYTTYSTFIDPGTRANGVTVSPQSFPNHSNVNSYSVAGTMDYKLTDSISLKSITAYRHFDGDYLQDFNGAPIDVQFIYNTYTFRQFTQELRLSGASLGETLHWTLGGFYYDAKGNFGGEKIQAPTLTSAQIYLVDDNIPSSSKAAYAQVDFAPIHNLDLIGGLRYTKESKDYTFGRLDPSNPTQAAVIGTSGPLNGQTGTYSGDNWDYRAGLQYQWTPQIMTYAQFSTGFKGGGVNPRPVNVSQLVPFAPEKLKAYEIGAKTELFDHHLRLNVSAFYNDYSNIVVTITQPAPRQVPTNAGEAHIRGAELEFDLRSFANFSINGDVSYLKMNYSSLTPAAVASGLLLSMVSPFTPNWQENVGAQYRFDLGSAGSLTPRVDQTYQSSLYTNALDAPDSLVAGYNVVNAHLSWASKSEAWSARLDVTNLFDRFYYNNKFFVGAPYSFTIGTPGRPREVFFSITRRFK